MKKTLIAAILLLPLAGCGSDAIAAERVTMVSLGFEKKVDISSNSIYQHNVSGNCYSLNQGGYGGSITQVVCSDFGILSPEQVQAEALHKKRLALEQERKKYLQMKAKFEKIGCLSKEDVVVEGKNSYGEATFSTPCSDVNEFGETPLLY